METLTTYNKISTEISEKLFDYLNTPETKEFIEKMKASEEDSGRFEVVISTADQDRQGEVIDQNGWDLSHYKNNPVVLWGHNYTSLPIGVADSVDVKGGKLVASGRFAPESANPFAQQVRRLYDAKILRTTSVGFMAREMDGNTITKAELLEFSFVPVPANPMALSLMKEISFDSAALIQKGFLFEEKATKEKPGDPCTTDDGEDGVFEEGEDGVLVCSVPQSWGSKDRSSPWRNCSKRLTLGVRTSLENLKRFHQKKGRVLSLMQRAVSKNGIASVSSSELLTT
jgi:hypothetical protein